MVEPARRASGIRLVALLAAVVVVVGALVLWERSSDPASSSASSAPGATPSTPATTPTPGASAEVVALDLGAMSVGGRVDGPIETLPGPGPDDLTYAVEVSEPGGRLRATLDLSNRDDCLTLELLDPAGVPVQGGPGDYPVVCPHADRSGQVFGIDLGVSDAAVGRWTVRIRAEDVQDLRLRLRATLDPTPPAGDGRPLAPDLVPWLPWEFGFSAPANAAPGTAHDRDNGPGDPTVSCHPEEEPEATHCLRFSAGVANAGDGPLSIVFEGDAAIQHVYLADATPLDHTDNERAGAYEDHLAGRGEWHAFHEHRHLASFVRYELYRDDGGTTKLIPLGEGGKHGYCTFSQQLRDWSSTAQDPQHASFPDGPFCDAAMTLERGWGDLYRWQRPGQYLSYTDVAEADGSMRAGRYVVRMTVDPDDHVIETDETNNVGYVVIEVVDGGGPGQDIVVVCETALGSGRGDPERIPVEDRAAWSRTEPAPACPTTPG